MVSWAGLVTRNVQHVIPVFISPSRSSFPAWTSYIRRLWIVYRCRLYPLMLTCSRILGDKGGQGRTVRLFSIPRDHRVERHRPGISYCPLTRGFKLDTLHLGQSSGSRDASLSRVLNGRYSSKAAERQRNINFSSGGTVFSTAVMQSPTFLDRGSV